VNAGADRLGELGRLAHRLAGRLGTIGAYNYRAEHLSPSRWDAAGSYAEGGAPGRHNGAMGLPRLWVAMEIAIVVCVLISAVIVIVKL
jgi:hypothetical protein